MKCHELNIISKFYLKVVWTKNLPRNFQKQSPKEAETWNQPRPIWGSDPIPLVVPRHTAASLQKHLPPTSCEKSSRLHGQHQNRESTPLGIHTIILLIQILCGHMWARMVLSCLILTTTCNQIPKDLNRHPMKTTWIAQHSRVCWFMFLFEDSKKVKKKKTKTPGERQRFEIAEKMPSARQDGSEAKARHSWAQLVQRFFPSWNWENFGHGIWK